MSKKNRRVSAEQERLNREMQYPENLSRRDKFLYDVVRTLGSVQAYILRELIREPVWRSTDGVVRRLRDLDGNHLTNILNMLLRDGTQVNALRQVRAELDRRHGFHPHKESLRR